MDFPTYNFTCHGCDVVVEYNRFGSMALGDDHDPDCKFASVYWLVIQEPDDRPTSKPLVGVRDNPQGHDYCLSCAPDKVEEPELLDLFTNCQFESVQDWLIGKTAERTWKSYLQKRTKH